MTTGHDLHRRRRRPLEPFFSRKGVSNLQPVLAEVAEKLAGRLEALKGTRTVVRLDHAFSAFSGDIIGRICWENQNDFLDDHDFAPEWYTYLLFAALGFWVLTHWQVRLDPYDRPVNSPFHGFSSTC